MVKKEIPSHIYEIPFWKDSLLVAGIDEVGRGALAGPVLACAIILPIGSINDIGCIDSKLLSVKEREKISEILKQRALSYSFGIIDHHEIDKINIRKATLKAMHLALKGLTVDPHHALIDGNYFEHPTIPYTTIIKGDYHCYSIAAASILAKVERDKIMMEIDNHVDSLYYFATNKGYGTLAHRKALQELGASPYHRNTFLSRIL